MSRIVRAFSFLAVLLSAVPAAGFAATLDEELNRLEEQRYEALIGADWSALDALLGEEFFYNTASGASLTKPGLIDYLKSGAVKVRKAVREDTKVRLHGDIALVTGITHVDVTMKGEDKTLHSRYLHVWAKDGQSWKLVARQATYLPEKK
jgi:hypothetical protein